MEQHLSSEQIVFLREAALYLEKPSYLMRVANTVGRPIQEIAARLIPDHIAKVGNQALQKAMHLAVSTVPPVTSREEDFWKAYKKSGWEGLWHKVALSGTGVGGGLFGISGLAIELPLSTGIMFRSIASIASHFGEDMSNPAVRLECLSVFSQGNPSEGNDALESSYLTSRVAMTKLIEDAVAFLTRESAATVAEAIARGTAPVLLRFMTRVATQFNILVTEKVVAQSLPLLGAMTGAAINVAFCDHFNTVARFHFGMRNLERRFGLETVQGVYREQVESLKPLLVG